MHEHAEECWFPIASDIWQSTHHSFICVYGSVETCSLKTRCFDSENAESYFPNKLAKPAFKSWHGYAITSTSNNDISPLIHGVEARARMSNCILQKLMYVITCTRLIHRYYRAVLWCCIFPQPCHFILTQWGRNEMWTFSNQFCYIFVF